MMAGSVASGRRDDAAALIARVAASAASGVARRALVLRLSALPRALTRPHHLRLARAALDPLRMADRAETFDLPNSDIAVVWRGGGDAALLACLAHIAELFADTETAGLRPRDVCQVLELPEQAEVLVRIADPGRTPATTTPPAVNAPALDPAGLAALEQVLAHADVARFVRRRPVHAIRADGSIRLAWEHRYLSIAELGRELAPGAALDAAPWLLRRLARTLDARLLALLAAPGELHGAGPFALDLGIASILGRAFLRFDAVLPAALRGAVVLGVQAPDVLADLPAFVFARDFVQTRGYRLLLHAPGPEVGPVLSLPRLGLDLLQLRFSRTQATAAPELAGAQPAQVVLGAADSAQAVAWGRRHGIALFEGPGVLNRS
jgi:hypothetical protein